MARQLLITLLWQSGRMWQQEETSLYTRIFMQQNHFAYAGFREKILDVIMQDVQTKPGKSHMAGKVSRV